MAAGSLDPPAYRSSLGDDERAMMREAGDLVDMVMPELPSSGALRTIICEFVSEAGLLAAPLSDAAASARMSRSTCRWAS
jgi:hypothetical protein